MIMGRGVSRLGPHSWRRYLCAGVAIVLIATALTAVVATISAKPAGAQATSSQPARFRHGHRHLWSGSSGVGQDSDPDSCANGEWIPTVTVVLPTHNRPSLVKRAVESVVQQTYRDWELIIVDDASTQDIASGVAEVLRDDRRVRLVRRTVNGGASAARNTGIEHARGRFVGFLDDDDEYLDHKLAHQVHQLESAPEDVVGVAGAQVGTSAGIGQQTGGEASELRREQLLDFDVWFVQIGSVLLRRDAVVELGFDESLPVIQDWDLYVRLLERHRMLRDREPVVLMHADSGAAPHGRPLEPVP